MNPKTTVGLIVALVIAAGTLWWVQTSSHEQPKKEAPIAQAVFQDLKSADVTGFEFKREGAPVCAFVKNDAKWQMTQPVNGPAEAGIVSGDVNKIANLKYLEAFKPGDPDGPSKEQTGLDKPLRVVKLTENSGKAFVLKIGHPQKLARKTYVQRDGDDRVFLVTGDLNNEMQYGLDEYRGKRVSEFAVADAVKIEMKGEKNYTLVKNNDKWVLDSPAKGRADSPAVNKMLQALSSLSATKFVEDGAKSLRPYGLEQPRLILTVSTEKKKVKEKPAQTTTSSAPAEPEFDIIPGSLAIAFGASAESNVFAKIAESQNNTVFQVAEDVVKNVAPALEDIRDKKIAQVAAARVQKIRVAAGTDVVELAKESGQWKIVSGLDGGASNTAEFAAVDDLLKAATDLTATGFENSEDAGMAFTSPRAIVELTVEGEMQPTKLVVGGLTPSKTGAYIKNETENIVAVVKPDVAEKFIQKPVAFLSREIVKVDYPHATRVSIQKTDQTISLEKDGGAWKVTAPVQGKAESVVVNNILSDLTDLRGRRVVARASDAAKYGLDHPNIKATVTVQPPAKPVATSQPASGPASQPAEGPEPPPPPVTQTVLLARHEGKIYAMAEGGPTICEIDLKVITDMESELLDAQVASVPSSEIKRISFAGDQPFTFEKSDKGWELSGESSFRTDSAKITQVVEAFAALKAVRFVKYAGANLAEYGLDKPVTKFTALSDGGQEITLSISARGPSGADRYATVSTQPGRVFVLKADDAQKFAKKVTDFVNDKT